MQNIINWIGFVSMVLLLLSHYFVIRLVRQLMKRLNDLEKMWS